MDHNKPFSHAHISWFLVARGYAEQPFDTKMYKHGGAIDYSFNFRVFTKPGAPRVLIANTCYSHYIDTTEAKIVKYVWLSRDEDDAAILRNATDWKSLEYVLKDFGEQQ